MACTARPGTCTCARRSPERAAASASCWRRCTYYLLLTVAHLPCLHLSSPACRVVAACGSCYSRCRGARSWGASRLGGSAGYSWPCLFWATYSGQPHCANYNGKPHSDSKSAHAPGGPEGGALGGGAGRFGSRHLHHPAATSEAPSRSTARPPEHSSPPPARPPPPPRPPPWPRPRPSSPWRSGSGSRSSRCSCSPGSGWGSGSGRVRVRVRVRVKGQGLRVKG